MAQPSYKDEASSYYPPRSRWNSRILDVAGWPVRRFFHGRRLLPAAGISWFQLLLSLALPGLGFLFLGRRTQGWLVLAAYVLSALVFFAALGFPAASIGYGLLISLHATSIVVVEGLWLKESGFGTRLAVAMATLVLVWGLIYSPLVGYIESHWFLPLHMGSRVLVVQCGIAPASIQRGDWLAYKIVGDRSLGDREDQVYLGSGWGIDPVLALPGDRLRFTPEAVFVNDKASPLAPHMPVQGEWVMPEKVWFIWPRLGISVGGRAPEASISGTLQRTAMVTQKQIIGRPFKHWFGRRQWP